MLHQKKKISLTVWVAVVVAAALLTLNTILDVSSIKKSEETIKNLISQRMLDISIAAANSLDPAEIAGFSAEDAGKEPEQKIKNSLSIFQRTEGVIYIYVVRVMKEDKACFVVDTDPVDPGKFGEAIVETSALQNALKGVAAFDDEAYSDRWGTYYSAYAPVLFEDGTVAGAVGVDFDAERYREEMNGTALTIILISLGSFVFGAVVVFIVTKFFKRRFGVLYGNLSVLADGIDALNREMVSNSIVEKTEAEDDASYQSARNLIKREKNAGRTVSGNVVERLGEKIQTMQSQLKAYVDKMHEQAYLDPGTGVRNKTAYLELVESLDILIGEGTADFAVVVFDLNSLKQVNDIHGHAVGDQFINDTAAVLMRVFRQEELFRIGGDEFIAVLEQCGQEKLDGILKQLKEETERFNAAAEDSRIPVSFSATGVFWSTWTRCSHSARKTSS